MRDRQDPPSRETQPESREMAPPKAVERFIEALARCIAQRRIDEIDRDCAPETVEAADGL